MEGKRKVGTVENYSYSSEYDLLETERYITR